MKAARDSWFETILLLIQLILVLLGIISCSELKAEMFDVVKVPAKPMSEAEAAALSGACLEHDAKACFLYSQYAWSIEKNFRRARIALEISCYQNYPQACYQIELDDESGAEIQTKCERGDIKSCILYAHGIRLIHEDYFGWIHYLYKACQLGDLTSCEGVKREQAKLKVARSRE